MKTSSRILMTLVGLGVACAAAAEEQPELAEQQQPSRWHISAGARLAPGVKTKASISSRAVADVAGRLRGANASKGGGSLPSGSSSSTERSSTTSSDSSTENVPITSTTRLEFENGFIDMNDASYDESETFYWHFDSADVFDEATGGITIPGATAATTSRETSTSRREESEVSTSSFRSSFSEQFSPDLTSSHEADIWGGDVEIGYDLWRGERFSLGLGLGATFYRGEDAIRAAGRCYAASSTTVRETATGHFITTTETTVETTETKTRTTVFTDGNFAYPGALDDIRNDDGSIGAGDPTGYDNPYGGGNPSLTLSDGSVTETTADETRKDTTVTTTRTFVQTGSRSSRSTSRRTIDVTAEGDVETQELRLALQPAWKAADWLELRGALGAVATRVGVDADATILVNGARFTTVSGDDHDWVFAGLCGLDAFLSPLDWLSLFVGADLRIGDTRMDYEAGLVKGKVELARATYRAGVAVRF